MSFRSARPPCRALPDRGRDPAAELLQRPLDLAPRRDEFLGFLGFTLVGESDQFKLYRNYYGEEFLVDRTAPYLFVDDVNDYEILRARSTRQGVVEPPPD